MNQTYFEWYELDVKVVHMLIATCTYEINIVVSINESECLVKFQYCYVKRPNIVHMKRLKQKPH